MGKYKAAIIGLGNIAWRFDCHGINPKSGALTHAEAFRHDQRVDLVAGSSPDKKECALFRERYGLSYFEDFRKMIANTKPDIVSICSPTDFHFEHLHYCLDIGIPMIWVEKPPAENLSQLKLLINRHKIVSLSKVLVNYQRRYAEEYVKLKQIVSKKLLGDVKTVTLTYSRGLLTNGCHNIDLLHYLLGDDISIDSYLVQKGKSDSPSFLLELPNGITVSVIGFETSYHCFDTVFTFENGRASVLHGGMTTKWETRTEHEFYPGFYRLTESEENPLGSGGLYCAMSFALSDLIGSYEENREPVSSLLTAEKSQILIETILSETGR